MAFKIENGKFSSGYARLAFVWVHGIIISFRRNQKRVWEGNERKHAKNIDALKLYLNILREPPYNPIQFLYFIARNDSFMKLLDCL